MRKRLTALTLAFVVIFTSAMAYAQTNSFDPQPPNEARQLYHGMTFDEFLQSDLYLDALDRFVNFYGFTLEYSINYLRTIKYIDNLSAAFGNEYGMWVFPDYVGGMYINNDGILVIQLTQTAMRSSLSVNQFNTTLSQYVNLDYVIVQDVMFSHSQLLQKKDWLLDWANSNISQDIFNALSVIDNYNRVVVHLWENTPEGIDYFRRTISDSPMIMFRQARFELDFGGGDIELINRITRIVELHGLTNIFDDTEQIRVLRMLLEDENADISWFSLPDAEERGANYPFSLSSSYQSLPLQVPSLLEPSNVRDRMIQPGQPLFDSNGVQRGSAGFRARRFTEGITGIVIAGHSFSPGQRVFNGTMNYIGTVSNIWQNSGNFDAAFLPLAPGISTNNTLLTNQTLATSWAIPVVGVNIAHQSSITARRAPQYLGMVGQITNVNHTVLRSDGNHIHGLSQTNLYAFPGDSGGPVYRIDGATFVTMGIVQGGTYPMASRNRAVVGINTNFMPANRIIQGFVLQRY